MPGMEILNILTTNWHTICTKETELPVAVQTQPSPRVQDVSNSSQTQDKRLASLEGL